MNKHYRWLALLCALYCVTHSFNAVACEGASACEGDHFEAEFEVEGEGEHAVATHAADQDGDSLISLSELLRVIQFFNTGSMSCDALSEDGYAPGDGDTACTPHNSDYTPQDWVISLSELLRLIQFFNGGGYHPCEEGEDGFCPGQPDNTPPPNVVFLILDTLRSGRIGSMRGGVPVAPFLDSFAAQGADFRFATSPSSWTRPAIAGFFTGLYPNALQGDEGAPRDERYNIGADIANIADWFNGHGFDCWAIQSNGNASAEYGFDKGFADGRFEFMSFFPAALITDRALETLPEWEPPFFSFIQYIDPHGPYAPPTEYAEVFGAQPALNINDVVHLSPTGFPNYVRDLFGAWANDTEPTLTPLSDNGKIAMKYRYDAEIRYLDDELARLIGAIEEAHPDTIFVIVSDHAEALQDREELIGHGHTLYEDQTRVPLIFKGPGVVPQTIETRVEALGILPALANLLELPPDPQWQGTDPFEQAATPGPVFSHTVTFFEETAIIGDSITLNGLKLIDHNKFDAPHLYDLVADPAETTDLAASRPADVATLEAMLEAHLTATTGGR